MGLQTSAHVENIIHALEEVMRINHQVSSDISLPQLQRAHLSLDINSPGSFARKKCCVLFTQWRTNCCSTLNELWVVQGSIFCPWLIFPLVPLGLSNFLNFQAQKIPCWLFRWGTVLQCSISIVFSSAVNHVIPGYGKLWTWFLVTHCSIAFLLTLISLSF